MGMFDSIMLNTKCPYCNKETIRECQTKDLECNLSVYNIGDKVKTTEKWLWSIAECKSENCLVPKTYGSIGKFFNLEIRVKKGKITDKYKMV